MKELSIQIAGVAIAVFVGLIAYSALHPITQGLGIALNEPTITVNNTTSTSVSCGNVSSLLVATSSGRTALILASQTSTAVTVCRSAACVAGVSGIILNSTSTGASRYEQRDAYVGPYSCITGAGTGTVGVTYSQ